MNLLSIQNEFNFSCNKKTKDIIEYCKTKNLHITCYHQLKNIDFLDQYENIIFYSYSICFIDSLEHLFETTNDLKSKLTNFIKKNGKIYNQTEYLFYDITFNFLNKINDLFYINFNKIINMTICNKYNNLFYYHNHKKTIIYHENNIIKKIYYKKYFYFQNSILNLTFDNCPITKHFFDNFPNKLKNINIKKLSFINISKKNKFPLKPKLFINPSNNFTKNISIVYNINYELINQTINKLFKQIFMLSYNKTCVTFEHVTYNSHIINTCIEKDNSKFNILNGEKVAYFIDPYNILYLQENIIDNSCDKDFDNNHIFLDFIKYICK